MAKTKKNNRRRSRNVSGGGVKPAELNYSVPTQGLKGSIGKVGKHGTMTDVCAMTDPFCSHARGSKIPADDSAPSVPYSQVWTYALGSDSAGRVGAQIRASPIDYGVVPGDVMTSSGISTWASQVDPPDNAVVSADATAYRVVSFGVRIYSLLAPTNQAGYLKCITCTDQLSASAAATTSGGLYEHVETYPIAGLNMHWVGAPIGVDWKEYISLATRPPYETLLIYGEGLPASTSSVLQIEIFTHYELQPKLATLAAALSTPGRSLNSTALAAASHVHSAKAKSHNGTTSSLSSKIVGLAARGISVAANQIMPGLGRMALTYLGGGNKMKMLAPYIEEVD